MKTGDFKDIIIFEDEDYIVVNKPPFLAALDERSLVAPSLKDWAKSYHPDASLCHRLDKETSGALAIAKNPEAYRNLAIQFEDRKVQKVYHAVSEGLHEFDKVAVDLPIYKLSNGTAKIDKARGKESLTYFTTLKAYKKHSLVECTPVTGRLHQIRVHLASMKASIACDERYGGHQLYLSSLKKHYNLKKDSEERPLISRVALHAFSLTFKGLQGDTISVIAEYPKDFAVLVKQLEKYS